MRYCLSAAFFCSAMVFLGAGAATSLSPPVLTAHFSPRGDCTASVVNAVAAAKETVLVQAYVLTSQPIATALAEARARRVKVEVILDGNGAKMMGSRYAWLLSKGVKVVLDTRHPIAHNKLMMIDGRKLFTGSFNFSAQAEKENAENLLEVNDEPLTKLYEENWRTHRRHCLEIPTSPPTEKPTSTTPPSTTQNSCPTGQCGNTKVAAPRWRR